MEIGGVSWARWFPHVILAFRRLKQEDHELEAILGYVARFCLKNKQKKQNRVFFLFWVKNCNLLKLDSKKYKML
jgi:hypothetical protein